LLVSDIRSPTNTGHTGSGHEGRFWVELGGSAVAIRLPPFRAAYRESPSILLLRRFASREAFFHEAAARLVL
jgi:hypothetical protein